MITGCLAMLVLLISKKRSKQHKWFVHTYYEKKISSLRYIPMSICFHCIFFFLHAVSLTSMAPVKSVKLFGQSARGHLSALQLTNAHIIVFKQIPGRLLHRDSCRCQRFITKTDVNSILSHFFTNLIASSHLHLLITPLVHVHSQISTLSLFEAMEDYGVISFLSLHHDTVVNYSCIVNFHVTFYLKLYQYQKNEVPSLEW